MKAQIEAILAPAIKAGVDAGCEFNGKFWEVWVGSHAGGREDGEGLARFLMEAWAGKAAQPLVLEPAQTVMERIVPDPAQAAKIAELEAKLAEAEAALEEIHAPQPVTDTPPEVVDILTEHGLNFSDSYERVNAVLVKRYADAMGNSEYARGNPDGTHGGKSVIEWLAIAARADSGVKWNRGRATETI